MRTRTIRSLVGMSLISALVLVPASVTASPLSEHPSKPHRSAAAIDRPRSTVDWGQDRFDATHSGYNPYETVIRKKTIAALHFAFGLQGNFIASPLEVAGLIDVPFEGRLEAIQPSGAAVWTRSFKGGLTGSPAGAEGSVYVPTPTTLYELNAVTGDILFRWKDTPSDGELVLTDDTVYVHTGTQLQALDRQTHELRWSHAVSVDAVPAVAGGLVYEPATAAQLVALDAATGSVRWGPVASAGNPAVADGMVFTAAGGRLTALDAATGAPRWQVQAPVEPGIPAVANGSIYAAVSDGSGLVSTEAFDESTGTIKWATHLPSGGGTNITVVRNLVFASCGKGVDVLDTDGNELRDLTTYRPWNGVPAPATVVNGHVYFYAAGKRYVFAAYD
jgi:outer membrane protein assembly factor BamB